MERWPIKDLQRRGARIVTDVERTGEPAVITRRGVPVAAVVPIDRLGDTQRDTPDNRGEHLVAGLWNTADTGLTTEAIMRITRGDD